MTIPQPLATSLLTLFLAMTGASAVAAAAQTTPAASQALTAEEAKPLVGDWTIAGNGDMGPVNMLLTMKVVDGKVVAEITSDATGKSVVTSIMKRGNTVTLSYSFDYQGNDVSASVALTPAGDAMNAVVDFAGGAYTVTCTATKKKAAASAAPVNGLGRG